MNMLRGVELRYAMLCYAVMCCLPASHQCGVHAICSLPLTYTRDTHTNRHHLFVTHSPWRHRIVRWSDSFNDRAVSCPTVQYLPHSHSNQSHQKTHHLLGSTTSQNAASTGVSTAPSPPPHGLRSFIVSVILSQCASMAASSPGGQNRMLRTFSAITPATTAAETAVTAVAREATTALSPILDRAANRPLPSHGDTSSRRGAKSSRHDAQLTSASGANRPVATPMAHCSLLPIRLWYCSGPSHCATRLWMSATSRVSRLVTASTFGHHTPAEAKECRDTMRTRPFCPAAPRLAMGGG
mmetsp:Transcript_49388/g.123855  ORF Transcript_49388/g.123855 Transcript_49388/m.123855 type:complete len:297 (+) Transcript_49388:244-1134(+)